LHAPSTLALLAILTHSGRSAIRKSDNESHSRYHHRDRFTIQGEHYAELKYALSGPEQASGVIFDIDIDAKNTHKFKLTKEAAKSIQSAFGPGWTPLQAIVFVYAALGVEWGDSLKTIKIESPAEDPAMNRFESFLEEKTFKACGEKV
jgi:hypothetical protein